LAVELAALLLLLLPRYLHASSNGCLIEAP
jgi:hypothetical protein